MIDLSTNYMGIPLKNPLIVGSSTLTDCADKLITLEQNGAAAIVLKSLYEEELRNNNDGCHCTYHPEAYNYDMMEAEMIYGISSYIDLIKAAKSKVSIPVIASLNCNNGKWWSDYPIQIEAAGADAIELNISYTAFDVKTPPQDIFSKYATVIESVRKRINIPIAVKFSPYSCSIPYIVKQMSDAGADAVVMFSRYFKVGIDLDNFQCIPVNYYSSELETYKVLRWVGTIHKQIDQIDICGSTGIHSSNEALQHLLAGAKVFGIVSTIYKNGPEVISRILQEIKEWMYTKEFSSLKEIRGLACKHTVETTFEKIHYNKVTEESYQIN